MHGFPEKGRVGQCGFLANVRYVFRPAFFLAQVVFGQVGSNSENPGFELGLSLKRIQVTPGLVPGFLHDVVGVGSTGRHAKDVGTKGGPDRLKFFGKVFLHGQGCFCFRPAIWQLFWKLSNLYNHSILVPAMQYNMWGLVSIKNKVLLPLEYRGVQLTGLKNSSLVIVSTIEEVGVLRVK